MEFARETDWRLAITVYLNRVVELAKLVGSTKIRHWPKNWEKNLVVGVAHVAREDAEFYSSKEAARPPHSIC